MKRRWFAADVNTYTPDMGPTDDALHKFQINNLSLRCSYVLVLGYCEVTPVYF